MANYEQALQWVLSHEGGYVNDPDDPGGETYKGVARKMNSKWDGWLHIDMLKKQSGFPANLDKDSDLQEAVRSFYEVNYWDRIKGWNLFSEDDSIEYAGVNPCAEEPLPAYGSCLLGSVNLSEFVNNLKGIVFSDCFFI